MTNVLVEAMHCGFENMIDYIFSEGFSNIRAILKVNNNLEIDNEVALFNTSYFLTHIDNNLPFLKKIYFNLIDLMQLSNFLEIFSYAIKGSFGESMMSNLS